MSADELRSQRGDDTGAGRRGRVPAETVGHPATSSPVHGDPPGETCSALWTIKQVAAELGLTVESVKSARKRGQIPAPHAYRGRRAYWRPDTIRAVAAARRQRAHDRAQQRAAKRAQTERRRANRAARAAALQAAAAAASQLWSLRDIAANTGLSYESVRSYRHTGILPQADATEGARPRWQPSTITAWNQVRLRAAAHGGRPRGIPRAERESARS